MLIFSGSFHADESLAVYMLRMIPRFQNAELLRSRDPEKLEECDIIVDVQGQYDGTKHFDHHQRGFEETFNPQYKTKLSSAGLVYKHFGQGIIQDHLRLDHDAAGKIHNKLYEDFIEPIDANDNGISAYPGCTPLFKERNLSLPSQVAALNPWWNEPLDDSDLDRRFEKAVALMGGVFLNRLEYLGRAWLPARDYVVQAIERAEGPIITLEQFVPWKEHLFEIEREKEIVGRFKYAIYSDGNNWRIQAVPENADSFESRKPLPQNWRGLRDEALSEKSGIESCIFVHATGFIGGNRTKEGAITMAQKALQI